MERKSDGTLRGWLYRLALKAAQTFTPISGGGYGGRGIILPNTKRDYGASVGDGLGSGILMAPMGFLQTAFPEAEVEIIVETDGEAEVLHGHRLAELLDNPNAEAGRGTYTGTALWQATLFDWYWGDAYWLKIRKPTRTASDWWTNVAGEVERLVYAPCWSLTPTWPKDGSRFISGYKYETDGEKVMVDPANVVHFRRGLNPRNQGRTGVSAIMPVLREIFTDDEASNFGASLMQNFGIPGLMMSPDTTDLEALKAFDPDAMKAYLKQQTTGDRRGEPFVSTIPAKLEQFGFNPKQLALTDIRNISEERMCAALGVPAAVVGFGSGLEQTKVGATLEALIGLTWTATLIPLQDAFADTVTRALVPEFDSRPNVKMRFNRGNVAALQPNKRDLAEAEDVAVRGGWRRVDHAQAAMGWTPDPSQALYLRTMNVIEVPAAEEGQSKSRRRIQSGRLGAGTKAASRAQRDLIKRFTEDALRLEGLFEAELSDFFSTMGGRIAEAAMDVLEPKASIEDELLADQILDQVEMEEIRASFETMGGEHYLRVAKDTFGAINAVMALGVDLPDERAVNLVAEGGRQMGLSDLVESTRRRLFKELADGRELGEGPVALARRIRDFVPAGRWSSAKVRARVIARTETLHAQRFSTLEAYDLAKNVDKVLAFDDRIGFGDEDCAERNGTEYTIDAARGEMADEHPNGTLSFAPIVGPD